MAGTNDEASSEPEPKSAPVPEPMDLAQLAALLDPQACIGPGAKDVLKNAHDLYVASAFYVSDTKRLTAEQLYERDVASLHTLGFKERLLEVSAEGAKLRLYRKDRTDGDPAKDYLQEYSRAGLRDWKKTRSVLDAIKKYFIYRANSHNTKYAKHIAELEASHLRMAAERGTTLQRLRNGMEIPVIELWFDAEEYYADFLVKIQVPGPEFDDDCKKIQSKIEYWEIPREFLDQIISWRHELRKRKIDWKGIRLRSREEIFGSEKSDNAGEVNNPKQR
jgi:hypothetical protein